MEHIEKSLIYKNPLARYEDVKDFILEGQADISFPEGVMRLSSALDPALGQAANYVLWCNEDFPSDVMIKWKFRPLSEIGLCIMFFSAQGCGGEDIFDEKLKKRDGRYGMYHSSDINAFHVSYYRTNFRTVEGEPAMRTCNLRKSRGFYMVAQGGDPIPELEYCRGFYDLVIVKKDNNISFYVNSVLVLRFCDDGKTFGAPLAGGKIGFRQMSPMTGEYCDLEVYEI